ncbi:hypothetical protein MZ018_02585 [Shewanella sp. JNE10-2]|uniref:hypothetical protein n=1 Tax=unclassified Shewanella TaxID=196818 RepID=UPI002003418F|nr:MULTISPECIES: hypothetical protein [unclassified Shewanella]MCK7630729.1 hypothetical protein [Shewanella sp. JNE9-1]MCK7635386.1 hypothetical protein [Shewanella sp. JNE17]MCK7646041.1 hypothetical protein [Shewanella sp. JNE3-1]MCK7650553.1 hypothetical protein [Shewanella sp. JNE8]MCK7654007.1 hypothetical protein [Shewanella sp. JNE4-1]
MNIPLAFSQKQCCQSQLHSTYQWLRKWGTWSLVGGTALLSGLCVSANAVAGNRDYSDHVESYAQSRDSYSRHINHADQRYDKRYRHKHKYRYYNPWGLGLGLGLATGWNSGWNLGYGWNTQWNNDWGWNTRYPYYREAYLRDNYARDYRNSPYSSIGFSIPMAYDDQVVAVSTPVRVTTSMQYAPAEGRMVSSMPASVGSQTSTPDSASIQQRRARTVSTLPTNARIVQQDGRTLYEWQGILYAFDWNSKTYQEQLMK